MRFISITTLCFLAASSSIYAAPVFGDATIHVSRRASALSSPSATSNGAEDLSINLGTVAKGAGIVSTALPFVEQLFGHLFGGNGTSSRRELLELLKLPKRQDIHSAVLSRQTGTDESDAISLGTIAKAAGIGSTIVGGLEDLFGHSGNSTKRDVLVNARRARDTSTAEGDSGAIGIGDLFKVFNIGSDIASGVGNVFGSGSDSNNQKRDLLQLLVSRAAKGSKSKASKLPSLTTVANVANIASSGTNIFEQLFGHSSNDTQAREFVELFVRNAKGSNSKASKLPSLSGIADAADIASSGTNIFEQLFGHSSNDTQAREFVELFVRNAKGSNSKASKLPSLTTVANIADIASSGTNIFEQLFGHSSNGTQAREFVELFVRNAVQAREDDSEALQLPSLKTLGNIGSIAGSLFSAFHDVLGTSASNSTQAREFVEALARRAAEAEDGDSEALSFKTLGTIGSLAGSAFSIFDDLFSSSPSSNSTQAREFVELLARNAAEIQTTDSDSEAISLKTLGTIGSVAGTAFGIFHDLFGSSSANSTQAREFVELLARNVADTGEDGSEAISFKTLGDIGSIAESAFSVFGGLLGHSPSSNNTQRREPSFGAGAPDVKAIVKALSESH